MILKRNSLLFLCLALLSVSAVLAADPVSFCKCTCFSNSTIIQLGPPAPRDGGLAIVEARAFDFDEADTIFLRTRDDGDDDEHKGGDDKKFRSLNCNDCNRKLCMEHELPKCKGATEEDIVTTCFQRDSSKDQAVVFIFIIATAGLLLWAAVKPWVERWIQAARERRSYLPLSAHEDGVR